MLRAKRGKGQIGVTVASTDSFWTSRELWTRLYSVVKAARHTAAAISYLGQGGATILPLKRGDSLVVDMSLAAVRQGVTDPREIQKLLRRGVRVASRRNLHAKFLVCDDALVVGSMNVSWNSKNRLDEAGLWTTRVHAVRQAQKCLQRWGGEPILDKQLGEAIRAYRPPQFFAADERMQRQKRAPALSVARVWFIGGLVWRELPLEEQRASEAAETRAASGFRRKAESTINTIHYGRQVRAYRLLRRGDWVIQRVASGSRAKVIAPARVVGSSSYPIRGTSRRRFLIFIEEQPRRRPIPWTEFLKRTRKAVPMIDLRSGRTRAISDEDAADALLALWSR